MRVQVIYGLHCFTRTPLPTEPITPDLIYHKNKEGRLFCETRWEHSMQLPTVISSLADRKCWLTDRRNHVMFSAIECDDSRYAIFFVLSRASDGYEWDANLLIVSAHTRQGFKPTGKPNRFRDLLRKL